MAAISCARHDDLAAIGQQLYTVVDGVFDKWLNRQARNACTHWQLVDVPADLQAITEAQFFDALVDGRDFELFL